MFQETINFKKLEEISNLLRYRTVKTSHEASIPHLGSCLSCVEILVYLYCFFDKIILKKTLKPS